MGRDSGWSCQSRWRGAHRCVLRSDDALVFSLHGPVVLSSSVVRDEGRFIVGEVCERARRRPGEVHSAFRWRSKLFCEVVAFDRLSLRTSCSLTLRIV